MDKTIILHIINNLRIINNYQKQCLINKLEAIIEQDKIDKFGQLLQDFLEQYNTKIQEYYKLNIQYKDILRAEIKKQFTNIWKNIENLQRQKENTDCENLIDEINNL